MRPRWIWGCLLVLIGCVPQTVLPPGEVNPFTDLPPINLNGVPQPLATNVAPLGLLEAGQVIRIRVTGQTIESVLILAADPSTPEAALLAGGGRPDVWIDYRVQMPGRYFVYVLFSNAVGPLDDESILSVLLPGWARKQTATITALPGNAEYRTPARQSVRVVFEPGYLTDPGLVDPESFTDEETQILVSISDLVRQQIMYELRSIFADTPVDIIGETDSLPSEPFSSLTFNPRREPAGTDAVMDTAIPNVDPSSPCAEPVIFGEVLPRGTGLDPGNRTRDDKAIVYVGSFQGRGFVCRSAATTSVEHIVLALSHTAAHEIGHLVGLYHVAVVDIMDRRPTIAFQRGLGFARGQILIEAATVTADAGTQIQTRVLTSIFQDPMFYFRANFGD